MAQPREQFQAEQPNPWACIFCDGVAFEPISSWGHDSECPDFGFKPPAPGVVGDGGMKPLAFERSYPSHDKKMREKLRRKIDSLYPRSLDEAERLMKHPDPRKNEWDPKLKTWLEHCTPAGLHYLPDYLRYLADTGLPGTRIRALCAQTFVHLIKHPDDFEIMQDQLGTREISGLSSYVPCGFPKSRSATGGYWWLRTSAYKWPHLCPSKPWRYKVHPFFWPNSVVAWDKAERKRDLNRRNSSAIAPELGYSPLSDELRSDVDDMMDNFNKHKDGLEGLLTMFPWEQEPEKVPSGA